MSLYAVSSFCWRVCPVSQFGFPAFSLFCRYSKVFFPLRQTCNPTSYFTLISPLFFFFKHLKQTVLKVLFLLQCEDWNHVWSETFLCFMLRNFKLRALCSLKTNIALFAFKSYKKHQNKKKTESFWHTNNLIQKRFLYSFPESKCVLQTGLHIQHYKEEEKKQSLSFYKLVYMTGSQKTNPETSLKASSEMKSLPVLLMSHITQTLLLSESEPNSIQFHWKDKSRVSNVSSRSLFFYFTTPGSRSFSSLFFHVILSFKLFLLFTPTNAFQTRLSL